ncbi:hypothetical protein ACFQZS_18875 [Mucilaginibacter calamicampi]|uniref:Rieske domain-containing protein n=1 Tax=Mucilaginibacter calamicampi TaxID=1302352 RepID=A0ABW2Z685_9SPHI
MKRLGIALLLLFAVSACGKQGNVVPYVAVNFQLQLNDPKYSPLRAVGSAVVVDGRGVVGVIVANTVNGYVAYDRCSAYEPEKRCAVTIDDNKLLVTDPCSGSKWLLQDGTPNKAPAVRSLRAYNVYIDASRNYLTVSN